MPLAWQLIREVPDFPEPGVLFRDLSPLFADGDAFGAVIGALIDRSIEADDEHGPDLVAGVEARGFLLAGAIGFGLGIGAVALRKPGKLPVVAHRVDYALEYGTASMELADGVIQPGQRVLIVDDVLATGGTAEAACQLVERVGGVIAGVVVVLEIAALNGRKRLANRTVTVLHAV